MRQALGLEQAAACHDGPRRVHEGGNAGVRGTGYPAALLHSPQDAEGKMLLGSGGPSEPCIVADVHQQRGPLGDLLAGQLGKDGFITNEHAQNKRPPIRRKLRRGGQDQRPGGLAGQELAHALQQWPQERQIEERRHVLPEGHKMFLVVPSFAHPVRRYKVSTVEGVDNPVPAIAEPRRAEQQGHAAIPRKGADRRRKFRRGLIIEGHGRFRPDQ